MSNPTTATAPSSSSGGLLARCGQLVNALTAAVGRMASVVVDVVRDTAAAVGRTVERAVAYLTQLTGWSPRTVGAVAFVVAVVLALVVAYVRRSWSS